MLQVHGQRSNLIYLICFVQIDHIFLTRVCSETAGGLPGMYIVFFSDTVVALRLVLVNALCWLYLICVQCLLNLHPFDILLSCEPHYPYLGVMLV